MLKRIVLFLLPMLAISACDEESSSSEWLLGRTASITIGADENTVTFPAFTARDAWSCEVVFDSGQEWLSLSENNGKMGLVELSATVASNKSDSDRSAELVVTCHGETLRFRVTQLKAEKQETPDEPAQKSRIEKIEANYYAADMARTRTETMTLTYDGDALTGAVVVDEDVVAQTQRTTTIRIETNGNEKVYAVSVDGGEGRTYVAQLADGRFSTLDDMEFAYMDGRLFFIQSPEQIWSFSWNDAGNIRSIVRQEGETIEFVASEAVQTGNLSLNAMCLMCLENGLENAVFAEKGLWGDISRNLLMKLTEGNDIYLFNYVADDDLRITQILQYYRYVNSNLPTFQKTYEITYSDIE